MTAPTAGRVGAAPLRAALRARTVAVDEPRDLLACLPDPAGVVWLRGGDGLVGWGEAARVDVGIGVGRFRRAAAALRELFDRIGVDDEVRVGGTGPVAFGSFPFDPRRGGASLVVPRVLLGRRAGRSWLTVVEPDGASGGHPRLPPEPVGDALGPTRIRYAGATASELRWLEAVATASERIREGALDKVVLARDQVVWSATALDARVLAARLSRRFPGCFTFSCDGLVGATPELLARRDGAAVTSIVLAGSTRRGVDAADDERLGRALLASSKDRREHELAVASVGEGLAPRCAPLRIDETPSLLRLDNVQHLATTARGVLSSPLTALEVAGALHPTAAVCGTPTPDAMALIRSLEGMDRGRYSGPVGWVDARGDGEWGIALRCAEVSGSRARLFAGAGIMGDSLPETELEETRLKLRAMQSAFEA